MLQISSQIQPDFCIFSANWPTGILTFNSLDRFESARSKRATAAKQWLPIANIWSATAHVSQGQMQYVLKGTIWSPAVVYNFYRSCGWIFNEKLSSCSQCQGFLIIGNNIAGKEHCRTNTH